MTPENSTHRSCPRGHAVPDQSPDCPVCGEPVNQADAEETRGRSLWDLMGQPDGDASPSDSTNSDQQQSPTEENAEPGHQDIEPPQEDQGGTEPLRSRGLWGMMQQGQDDPGDAAEETMPQLPEIEPMELAEATEVETGGDETGGDDPEQASMVTGQNLSRSCRTSLVTGIAATLLAGLGLVPPVIWTSLPALLAGLVAVYTGLVGASETRSSPDRLRGWREAVIGIGLGTLGMFLPRLLQMLAVA